MGAFARVAAPAVGPSGVVYAVEPLRPVHDALALNAARYAAWAAAARLPVGRVVPVHAGCGAAGGPPEVEFTYYPRITAFSSMYR